MAKPVESSKGAGGTSSSWTMSAPRDLAGKTLGDFHVERLLGEGGMGQVYLARQVSLDRPVALKVLKEEWTSNPTYMSRFESEAWAAAKINHPNIVHIYSLGDVGGLKYIAMEYVQGTNLREYLQKKGVPDLALALAIMRQAGLAVGAAGEAGLIHRDIKPENLLMTRKGQIKVADFGLAQLPEADRLHLTTPGTTLGTPMYMSPEQVQGEEVDHRSDLYSLGVTFYHMLSGSPPFRAETAAAALALKHVRDEPVSLGVLRPELPPQLVALVMKLMAKSPSDRHESAGEMLKDLARIKEQVQASAASSVPTLVDTSLGAARPQSTLLDLGETPERSWIGARAFWLCVLPALLVGGLLGWNGRAEDLLGSNSPPAESAPGVWMADWKTIPKKSSAAAQYRYAQVRATSLDVPAAWLAVPARFPKESDWSFASYIQLARHDLRRGDAERLATLARDLKESEERSESPRQKWMNLAKVVHSASSAIRGDADEVLESFLNLSVVDPALAELSLEVLTRATKGLREKGIDSARFDRIRRQIIEPLNIPPAIFDRISGGSK